MQRYPATPQGIAFVEGYDFNERDLRANPQIDLSWSRPDRCPFEPTARHDPEWVDSLRRRASTEWTLDEANSFRVPFGKYEGLTLAEILEAPRGADYLRWILDNQPKRKQQKPLAVAVRIVLGSLDKK